MAVAILCVLGPTASTRNMPVRGLIDIIQHLSVCRMI